MVVEGLMNVFSDPLVILFIAIGVIVGIIFGSIPGLTATMAIVMFLLSLDVSVGKRGF